MNRFVIFVLLATAAPLFATTNRESVMRLELPKLQNHYRAAKLKPLGPETPLTRIYYERLNRFVRYAEKDMQPWPAEPGAKFHKLDTSREASVRQNGKLAFALAILARYGDFDEVQAGGVSRARVRADAVALVRYLSVTHVSNFLPLGDGKSWGDAWQSAYWAGFAGGAAWLLWDDLPNDTKVMAARMVIHEANRFNTRPPDNGEVGDTKAEENGWNSEIIALAACMFQRHPNAKLWNERAIIYMINSYSTAADNTDARRLDGRRIRDWVTTTNIHSDFTLENHARVHPDYLSCFTLNLKNANFYRLAGRKPPAATFHHARDCNDVLMYLTATNGSIFYINGQDWWPHLFEEPMIAEGLASVHFSDADAACLERGALASLGRMHERFNDGRAYLDRETPNHSNVAEELMFAYAKMYLTHRLFGEHPKPVSPQQFQEHQSGTRIFESGGFVTHRTPGKFVSLCWANEVMGLVYPSEDTWFTSPQERSLIGEIEIKGATNTRPLLESHVVKKLQLARPGSNDGFTFVGKLSRCEGKVEQRIAVISLPDAPVLYVEQLRARQSVDVKEIATATVSILNEDAAPMTSNERRVWTDAGEKRVPGPTGANHETHVWKTRWANLDDKLGVTAHATGQMMYLANHKFRRARLTQTLAANYAANLGLRQPGEIFSEAVVELLPNATHAHRGKLEVEQPDKNVFLIHAGEWRVFANLGETNIQISVSGKKTNLPGFGVTVQRAND